MTPKRALARLSKLPKYPTRNEIWEHWPFEVCDALPAEHDQAMLAALRFRMLDSMTTDWELRHSLESAIGLLSGTQGTIIYDFRQLALAMYEYRKDSWHVYYLMCLFTERELWPDISIRSWGEDDNCWYHHVFHGGSMVGRVSEGSLKGFLDIANAIRRNAGKIL
jgi:hypothetical protein